MPKSTFTVDDISSPSLAMIAQAILGDEFSNDGQAAIALQEAGYTIQEDY